MPSASTSSNNNDVTFVLPEGLDCLSDGLPEVTAENESGMGVRDLLDKDLATYIRGANSHMATLQAEAKARAKKDKKARKDKDGKIKLEVIPKDPLDFWFAQVRSINNFLLFVTSFMLRKALNCTRRTSPC